MSAQYTLRILRNHAPITAAGMDNLSPSLSNLSRVWHTRLTQAAPRERSARDHGYGERCLRAESIRRWSAFVLLLLQDEISPHKLSMPTHMLDIASRMC
jgi:hypothetical protein